MQPNDQYGFIMNPNSGQQKKSFLPTNFSKKNLIILGVAAFLLIAVLVTVLFWIINSGPDNKDQLIATAAKQNELIRISEIAVKEAQGTEAKNLAQTTRLSLRSDQSTLVSALRAQKVKVSPKQLRVSQSSATDKKLTEATQSNRFDIVYLEFIQEALVDYQRSLNEVYKTTTSPKLKETLKTQYENASLIIGVDPEV